MPNPKGMCSNCGRGPLSLIGKDKMCFTCFYAGRYLTGEDQEKALAETKERLDSGEKRKTGPKPKGVPPVQAVLQTSEPTATNVTLPENWGKVNGKVFGAPDKKEPESTVIPVHLKLTIEIAVLVSGVAQ